MRKRFVIGAVFAILLGCGSDAPSQSKIEALSSQIGVFRNDPAVITFLAEEAARAGVRSIQPYPDRVYKNGRAPGYGVARSGGRIWLDGKTPGGCSIVNITHEIAHVASFGGKCGGHNAGWLSAYRGIAERFEARFPTAKWSGTTPTARVNRNVDRYKIGSQC